MTGSIKPYATWIRPKTRNLRGAMNGLALRLSRRLRRRSRRCISISVKKPGDHVVAKLLQELPPNVAVPALLVEQARVLDSFYIPPRYPNGHPEGAPFEHYGSLQSEEAVRYASAIVEFVRAQMAR